MKKKIPLWAALCGCLVLCAACSALLFNIRSSISASNFTNEMKIQNFNSLNENGAGVCDRVGDHTDSPYFYNVDFYNAESTGSLFILHNFKTLQQTSWWSCGPASIMMVLEHYETLGNWNEERLAALRSDHSNGHIGTCTDQMIEILNGIGGFNLETTYDCQKIRPRSAWSFSADRFRRATPFW